MEINKVRERGTIQTNQSTRIPYGRLIWIDDNMLMLRCVSEFLVRSTDDECGAAESKPNLERTCWRQMEHQPMDGF